MYSLLDQYIFTVDECAGISHRRSVGQQLIFSAFLPVANKIMCTIFALRVFTYG